MQDLIMELLSNNSTNFEESNSENEDSDEDMDEFSGKEFPAVLNMSEKLVSEGVYILSMSSTKATHPNVAVALSNHTVKVFNCFKEFQESTTVGYNNDKTVDLKFSEENDNLLWTGTHNGTICLWDLRAPEKAVSSFTDTTDDKTEKDRKFNGFDISVNGRLLCAATDVFDGDSFLLFWDIRKCNLLGGFWESHVEDITQVRFHPSDSNKMISGSTDGLINIYDLSQSCEDDALIDSLNTESSIEKLTWTECGSRDIISCVTHTSDIQLWKTEDAQPYCNFTRSDIAQNLKRTSENYIYVVDVHMRHETSMILAGSNANSGECARGLKLEKSLLKPAFGLPNNRQRIRCSYYNENSQLLLTGGEKGYLNAWKLTKESE